VLYSREEVFVIKRKQSSAFIKERVENVFLRSNIDN
jgi:hypothetical protein